MKKENGKRMKQIKGKFLKIPKYLRIDPSFKKWVIFFERLQLHIS